MSKKKFDSENLEYTKKSSWEGMDTGQVVTDTAGYLEFISRVKTERECVDWFAGVAQEKGFKPYDGAALKPGDRFYVTNRGKAILLGIRGTRPLTDGFRLVGAHVDAPRLDLKAQPLYEDEGLGLLKTHYYGGIKKYQWTAIPLALHGTVVLGDGTAREVVLGEDPGEPVFTITDLLPHLAREQMKKPMSDALEGEDLNLLAGAVPLEDEEDKKVKRRLLGLLNRKFGLKEEDFISAELEAVPAGPARDVGLDRRFIGGYGQDDRVCAYGAADALMGLEEPDYTAFAYLTDKEEIGSSGDTGAQSRFLDYVVGLMAQAEGLGSGDTGRIFRNSKALSADVTAGQDPSYKNLFDPLNAPSMGKGLVITKYTGSRGKYDANDASAEYTGWIRRVFNQAGVVWQTGELGKVDQGGGGTIAMYLSRLGMETIDCGPPLLSMHSPFEIADRADILMMIRGYRAFLESGVK